MFLGPKPEWCPFCGETHRPGEGPAGYSCQDESAAYYEEVPEAGPQWSSTGTDGALDDGPS